MLTLLSHATGLLTWACINFSFIRFYYGCKRQGIDRNEFPFKAPFVRDSTSTQTFLLDKTNANHCPQQPWASMFGLFMIIMVIIFNGKHTRLAAAPRDTCGARLRAFRDAPTKPRVGQRRILTRNAFRIHCIPRRQLGECILLGLFGGGLSQWQVLTLLSAHQSTADFIVAYITLVIFGELMFLASDRGPIRTGRENAPLKSCR